MDNYTFINKVGIELEGAWAVKPNSLQHDGSVKFEATELECEHVCHCLECSALDPTIIDQGRSCSAKYIGEVASKPIAPRSVSKWVRSAYPQAINPSCGFHIHVSFKNINSYLVLMDRKFYEFFLTKMQEFGDKNKIPKTHPFWSRLRGENRFCKREFNPDKQINEIKKYHDFRYQHLNFCHTLHGTMENRLFPMFKEIDLAVAAVYTYLDCLEEYLSKNALEFNKYQEELEVEEFERVEFDLFSIVQEELECV